MKANSELERKKAHIQCLKAMKPLPAQTTNTVLKRHVGYTEEDKSVMEAQKQFIAMKLTEKVDAMSL
jgi:hypothetical protein